VSDQVEARWALVLPLREHMLAVARRRCATAEDAEDCVHEAMLRVVQFENLDAERVAALLTSVTTRLAVDMHRRRARAERHLARLVSVPAQHQAPDEAVLDAGEARWLATQVRHLPEREQAVFRQRAAGYSAGEAAARLSLSYKAVESAFTRARGRMRAWAAAGTLLVLEYLRRLRQRPSTALTASMMMVSAGVLLATSSPPSPTQAEDRPRASTATTHEAWLDDAAPAAAHLQAPAAASPARTWQAQPALPHASPAATPPPGVPHKRIAGQDIPATVKQDSVILQIGITVTPLPGVPGLL